LARRGANVTGLSIATADFTPKLVELLLAVRPNLTRLAVLARPRTVSREIALTSVQNVAQKIGVAVTTVDVEAQVPGELARGFAKMNVEGVEAVIVANEPTLNAHRRVVAELAIHHRLPAIVPWREYADDGLLMSYGPLRSDFARQAATYVDKILKGAKPTELPIEQPSRLYLIINLKTARSLGLEIPPTLLLPSTENGWPRRSSRARISPTSCARRSRKQWQLE
jgi:putative ABC transport system substrate-binding protein